LQQSYSKPSSLSQLLYRVAEKWQEIKTGRASAPPQLPEGAAWQQLRALATDSLEVTMNVPVKSSLPTFLTTLHQEVQHQFLFRRSSTDHDWQLVQHWDPLAG
jgi:hypothetical protein